MAVHGDRSGFQEVGQRADVVLVTVGRMMPWKASWFSTTWEKSGMIWSMPVDCISGT